MHRRQRRSGQSQAVHHQGPVELDAETTARIANSMANFEMVYKIAADEVGEDFAPLVLDMMM